MIRILLLTLALSACSDVGNFFDAPAAPDARARYEADGATGIHLVQADAVNTSTIIPVVFNSGFIVKGNGCDFFYDLSQNDPANIDFWQAQPTTIDFDIDSLACNTAYHCSWPAPVMNGTIVEVNFTCVVN